MTGEFRPGRRAAGLMASVSTAAVVLALAGAGQALAAPAGGPAAASAVPASAVPVTAAVRSELTSLYAVRRGIPGKDIAALTAATVQETYQASAHTWWAVARFVPAAGDPLTVSDGFQDGAGTVVFTRQAGGWHIARIAGSRSLDCRGALPAGVQRALNLTDTAGCAAPSEKPASRTVPRVRPAVPNPGTIASIAAHNIGVADTPASTSFGFDCDPYTTLVGNTWVSTSGCGTDPTFKVQNRNEEWCADFAKYVWQQGGVTAGTGTLTAAASSFYTWGKDQGESLPVDPSGAPPPGDAVVIYSPGEVPGQTGAAHVGIVVSDNSNGTINMANGDFLGSGNISVQGNDNVSIGPWSASIYGSGTTWVFVSPGSSAPASAFQANTGNLWLDNNGNAANEKLGMMPGTSPAAAAASNGATEVAFQANTGYLWTESNGTGHNTTLGMMPGTSPAIAGLSTGGYEIAFQSSQGELWLVSASGTATDQKLGMMSGTSPAITALPGGGFEVAFQANTGNLWIDNGSSSANEKLGMARGSSPAITAAPGGGYQAAFQANSGNLWTDTNGAPANLKLGVLTGTSPAITTGSGGIVIAFQANTGFLWTVTRNGSANTELGMMAGTSPAITAIGSGTEIAFQASTGNLWFDTNGSGADQKLGMLGGTSPAITTG